MSKFEKIKKIILIALGFGLSTYMIMSGVAMLNKDISTSLGENNGTSEVHRDIKE